MFCFIGSINAQETFDKGTNVINLGLAFGHNLGGFIPGVGVEYDHCIVDGMIDGNASIGVGGYLGVGGYRRTLIGEDKVSAYMSYGARGSFHYQFFDDIDTYAGVIIGGRSGSFLPFDPYPSAFVGIRYYTSDSFAWFAELGSGVGYFNIGASFRF